MIPEHLNIPSSIKDSRGYSGFNMTRLIIVPSLLLSFLVLCLGEKVHGLHGLSAGLDTN